MNPEQNQQAQQPSGVTPTKSNKKNRWYILWYLPLVATFLINSIIYLLFDVSCNPVEESCGIYWILLPVMILEGLFIITCILIGTLLSVFAKVSVEESPIVSKYKKIVLPSVLFSLIAPFIFFTAIIPQPIDTLISSVFLISMVYLLLQIKSSYYLERLVVGNIIIMALTTIFLILDLFY